MKTIIKTTAFAFLALVFVTGRASAQSSGGGQPPYVLQKIEEGLKVPRIHKTPPTVALYRGYPVPRAVISARQNGPAVPPAAPVTDAEKRRILLEQLNKYKSMARSANPGVDNQHGRLLNK